MQLQNSITIGRDADQVWEIVAHRFAEVGEWSSAVTFSGNNPRAPIPDGASVGGRVCSVPGIGELEETFIAYSEEGKQFTFAATGLPSYISLAQNTVTVRPTANGSSEVSLDIHMETTAIGRVMGPMFKIRLRNTLNTYLAELKAYAESGQLSPKKRKQLAKSA